MKAFEMVDGEICPAYAGMILKVNGFQINIDNLSRVCGDDPEFKPKRHLLRLFVPRMRG